MHKGRLKKLRVVISLIFFILIAALFLDFTGTIYVPAIHTMLHLQFVPSLILFLSAPAILALGFALIILLTLLFGRIYCSTLCPLGTLQDIFIYLSKKLSPRKKIFRFHRPQNLLRYIILAGVIISVISGTIILVNLLDPYSIFGKIFNTFFRPLVALVNNLVSEALAYADVYSLARIRWVPVNRAALVLALVWIIVLVVLSLKKGRLYCNTICPVGALLGIFAKVSLFRIRLDKTMCNSCGKCSSVCKAECIDPKDQKVDFSRCVGCMNCLSPCPDNGVKFKLFWKKDMPVITEYNAEKREFFKKSGLILAGTLAAGGVWAQDDKKKETIPGTIPVFRECPVTPPGAVSQERFNNLCTACHLCVAACPTQVLQPSYFLYGMKGFLQPRMDYITSFCNYECTLCGEVCPTGAILPLPVEEKKLVQLGKAHFVKENCVVYTRNTACGACSEHCPTKAVNMIPYTGKLTIPEVNDKICIGCGACEYACPTDAKSIYVEGNIVHLAAEKPKEEKLEENIDYKEEFPF